MKNTLNLERRKKRRVRGHRHRHGEDDCDECNYINGHLSPEEKFIVKLFRNDKLVVKSKKPLKIISSECPENGDNGEPTPDNGNGDNGEPTPDNGNGNGENGEPTPTDNGNCNGENGEPLPPVIPNGNGENGEPTPPDNGDNGNALPDGESFKKAKFLKTQLDNDSHKEKPCSCSKTDPEKLTSVKIDPEPKPEEICSEKTESGDDQTAAQQAKTQDIPQEKKVCQSCDSTKDLPPSEEDKPKELIFEKKTPKGKILRKIFKEEKKDDTPGSKKQKRRLKSFKSENFSSKSSRSSRSGKRDSKPEITVTETDSNSETEKEPKIEKEGESCDCAKDS